VDRCALYDDIRMSYIFLDQETCGGPLMLYIKMPGGVPGLEYDVTGDDSSWDYKVEIGDYESNRCDTDKDYKQRLYCQVNLPAEYLNSLQTLSLYINGCDRSVYSDRYASLPASACVVKPKPVTAPKATCPSGSVAYGVSNAPSYEAQGYVCVIDPSDSYYDCTCP
jgi:hypothetical protein